MFHKASLKLAALYLGILMTISVSFSIALYQVWAQELTRDFNRQNSYVNDRLRFQLLPRYAEEFRTERLKGLEESKRRVVKRLVVTNVGILVLGGLLSYTLARRTLRQLEEAHEAQVRFTADASHELRTPLTIMRTEIEAALASKKLSSSDARELLQSNLDELEKLRLLTENLLKLARLEDSSLQCSEVDLHTCIDSAIARVLPLAEQKFILIESPSTTMRARAHEESLIEVLVILLDNAIKYSPAKTAVTISVEKRKDTVAILVSDQGVGIHPADQKHVFERFYRSDPSRSTLMTPGHGLGLAIADRLISLQGGSIAVSSEPNKGTTFTVLLAA